MKKTSSSIFLYVIFGIIAFVLVIDPFGLFKSKDKAGFIAKLTEFEKNSIVNDINFSTKAQDGIDLIVKDHQVILMSYSNFTRFVLNNFVPEQLGTFIASTVERLPGLGVNYIGLGFINYDQQSLIDSLLSKNDFDELGFNSLIIKNRWSLANEATLSIFKAIWKTAKANPQSKLKIVCLGHPLLRRFETSHFEIKKYAEIKKQIENANPAKDLAQIVSNLKQKILILDSQENISNQDFLMYTQLNNFYQTKFTTLGHELKQLFNEQLTTIDLCVPWELVSPDNSQISFPYNGIIEAGLRAIPPNEKPSAPFIMPTKNTAFGSMKIVASMYNIAPRFALEEPKIDMPEVTNPNITVHDIADYIVYLGPYSGMKLSPLIPIKTSTESLYMQQFPFNELGITMTDFNDRQLKYTAQVNQLFADMTY